MSIDRLMPDPDWYKATTNQRVLRRYRLTAPIYQGMLDSLPKGFREILHALSKDIYDNYYELDYECTQLLEDYNPFSLQQVFTHVFNRMDLNWEGMPEDFKTFVRDHL